MRKGMRWLIILGFLSLVAYIAYQAPRLEIPKVKKFRAQSQQDQFVRAKNIKLHYKSKNQKGIIFGTALKARHHQNTLYNIEVSNPKGVLFKQKDKISYKANMAYLPRKEDHMKLRGDVSFDYKGFFLKGQKFDYFTELSLINGNEKVSLKTKHGNDRLNIKSDRLEFWMDSYKGNFTGNVVGNLKKSKVYQEGVRFKSNSLFFDQEKALITLSGGLKIDMGQKHVSGLYGDIFLNNYSKKLKYYALYDDIEFTENFLDEEGRNKKRRAYAQKIEGFVRENKVILTGAPEVKQENNVIRGYQITLYGDSEIIEVDESRSNLKVEK